AGSVGTTYRLDSPGGPVTYQVVGLVAAPGVLGLAGSMRTLEPFAATPWNTTVLLQLRSGSDAASVARDIERSLFGQGVEATTADELLGQLTAGLHGFLGMVELLMAVGLGIGVTSLGILALRSAIERRRAIGVLRALGYPRWAVLIGILL